MKAEQSLTWVRPLSGEKVSARPHAWRLETFSAQARQADAALEAVVLEKMRAALQPELEAEVAELKAQAQEAGREAGYREGYEAGFEEGRAAGERQAQEAWAQQLAQWREDVSALSEALMRPFSALEDELADILSRIICHSVETLVGKTPALQRQILAQGLRQVLPTLRNVRQPIVVHCAPDLAQMLQTLLPAEVSLEPDAALSDDRIVVRQGETLAEIDWRQALDDVLNQIAKQLVQDSMTHDPSSCVETAGETAPAER